ncbi:hypothetical protein NM688_g1161 [Phlebia brevispora]|uniref:Uncharacterized protein n=1 Tax=Phlebia brevispora TaxID=194682 RepID=A0ACC1TC39_9APHY|nr:hypothetical protein NM688_g1161 [Phlebia brevispora]
MYINWPNNLSSKATAFQAFEIASSASDSQCRPRFLFCLLARQANYIDSSVLVRLLAHPDAKGYEITVLVRSEEKAKKLQEFGVKTIMGSFDDNSLVESLAEEAHVIFSIAYVDDLPFAKALLSGLRKRHERLGDLLILIHTSGTGTLTAASRGQDTKGMYVTDIIFDDTNTEQIETLPPSYIKVYIILPSTVYGVATNALVDAGIQNAYSMQIPMLIKGSLRRGQAGMVGKGLPLWNDVHIDNCADLYIILWDAINTNPDAVRHGREGYYFLENGEHLWYKISKEIGHAMVALCLSTSDEPTSFSEEELLKYFGSLACL